MQCRISQNDASKTFFLPTQIFFFISSSLFGSKLRQLATTTAQMKPDARLCTEHTYKCYRLFLSLSAHADSIEEDRLLAYCTVLHAYAQTAAGPERSKNNKQIDLLRGSQTELRCRREDLKASCNGRKVKWRFVNNIFRPTMCKCMMRAVLNVEVVAAHALQSRILRQIKQSRWGRGAHCCFSNGRRRRHKTPSWLRYVVVCTYSKQVGSVFFVFPPPQCVRVSPFNRDLTQDCFWKSSLSYGGAAPGFKPETCFFFAVRSASNVLWGRPWWAGKESAQ